MGPEMNSGRPNIYLTSRLNSPILIVSIEMTIVAVQLFWARIEISTDQLFIIWTFDISAWNESFVERIVNEKGSKPEYGFPSLSFISRVRVATSPSLRGDFAISITTRSFCVIKCVAISLKFSNVSGNFLCSEFCVIIVVGITGTTTSGIVGVGGITTGVVGTIGVVGCVGTMIVGIFTVGIVGLLMTGTFITGLGEITGGNICGIILLVPVCIIGSVESTGGTIGCVVTVVLLL